jgi:hypothetical protein
MRTLGHYGNYCKSCDRFFDNENNLRKVYYTLYLE